MKKKQKSNQKKAQIPQQLQFQPPVFNFSMQKHQENSSFVVGQNFNENHEVNFSAQDRQSLKNAFRYICRLIFKQAPNHIDKIKQIAQNNDLCLKDNQKFKKLFQKAQQISGERYFRKYICNFQQAQQKTICQYMHWFLTVKYLRYISEQGKGKRKKMKKTLYIKFKNQVMLPYINSLL